MTHASLMYVCMLSLHMVYVKCGLVFTNKSNDVDRQHRSFLRVSKSYQIAGTMLIH